MLFHLAWSILLEVFAWQTAFSLVEIFQQPIRNFQFKVFKANTPNKNDYTMWKSMNNCAWKWCQKLCAFLFAATWAFKNMWCNNSGETEEVCAQKTRIYYTCGHFDGLFELYEASLQFSQAVFECVDGREVDIGHGVDVCRQALVLNYFQDVVKLSQRHRHVLEGRTKISLQYLYSFL